MMNKEKQSRKQPREQQSGFERCVSSATRRLGKISAMLEEIQIHLQRNNMESVYGAAFEAADHAEKLTNLCRVMPAYSGHPKAHEMIDAAMLKNFPVEIGFTAEGWFCLRMPALLPKKNKGSPAYVTDPLYPAMKQFWNGKEPVRYPYNVTVFRHVYDRERPERQYRDHDNTEVSAVLNIVALYVMVDDSALRCEHFYCSAPGNDNRTEIYVIPQDEFSHWLKQKNNIPEEGVKLYENLPKHI